MLKAKIEKYFLQFPELRVLFFFDEQGEYRAEVEGLEIPGIRKLFWNNNGFYLKTLLHGAYKADKVLLYLPMAAPRDQDAYHAFPLLGLLVANKELSLDDVGEFMDDYHLQRNHKNLVSRFIRELKYSSVQEVCRPILNPAHFDEPQLVQGLISAFLRFNKIESWSLLLGKMLTLALPSSEDELNRFRNKIEENQLLKVLQKKTHDYFGQGIESISAGSMKAILRRILYNKITQTLPVRGEDPYRPLKMDGSTLVFFNQFLHETDRSPRLREKLLEVLDGVKNDIQSQKLIDAYGADAGFAWYPPDMLWHLMELELPNLKTQPARSRARLENLSLQEDIAKLPAETLQFLIQAARMFEQINGIEGKYILDTPDQYLDKYAQSWMQVDTAYRRAVRIFRHGDLGEAKDRLDFDGLMNSLNTEYEQHLDAMNREWLKCLNQYHFDYHNIRSPKQYDFYKTEVEPYEQKVVVVISDGLRYEAAVELLSALHSDPKNTAEIRYCLASIPSKTNIGMAQLLPSREIDFKDGTPVIDGIKTEGIANRRQILLKHNPEAAAEQYSVFNGKNQEERREIFKNKVVYVYHDVIDARGDKSASEDRTFLAVDEAITDLKQFVKSLHATYNVARVLITSDHGFLYNDRPIEEKDKENSPNGKVLQNHNRFELSTDSKPVEMGYKFPLSATTKFREDLFVTIPQSVNRYKLQGVGHQYVHGGGSLQELVVPVIESTRKRQEVTGKVKPQLLKREPLKVVSSILRVQIFQADKVSRYEKERTVSLGLYKDLELVSNEQLLTLNSTEEAASERMYRVELTLASKAAKEPLLKFKVFDVEDKLNPLIEELVQNSTLIETDF